MPENAAGDSGRRPALPPPALVVVVVAYGAPDDLRRCLGTLGQTFPVFVIDNSSSAEVEAVARQAAARYRDAGANLGFAAGVNLALAEIDLSTEDVLLLNPDATIEPGAVRELHRQLCSATDVACVAPAQRHPGPGSPVRVCWPFATPGRAWAEAFGLGRFRRGWDFVIGSILLVRGRALLEVGGFDETFFLYGEEADWEHRAKLQGWRVDYCPAVAAFHVGSATDTDAGGHLLRFHAGVEHYVRKWHGAAGWRSYQAASVLTAVRRSFSSSPAARRRSLRLAWLYVKGPSAVARRAGAVPDPAGTVARSG